MLRVLLLCAILPFLWTSSACAGRPAHRAHDEPRLGEIQVIGSHNSYKLAPQPQLRELLRPFYRDIDSINYSHLSIDDQLNLGLRNLEIDVYHDPSGGRYADPMGLRMLKQAGIEPWPRHDQDVLNRPGFKVMHDADFDFRSWDLDLQVCLRRLATWSKRHPDHEPIVVTMNTKQGQSRIPGAVAAAEFDALALRQLDAAVIGAMGRDVLLTPDDVRGTHASLRDAVVTRGWPSLSASRGRFIFVLDEGGATRSTYLSLHPHLGGAVFFVDSGEHQPESAFLVINDPVKHEQRIRDLVMQGFLVRTRADADTREARTNDRARFEAAKRSGAQIITTDYYIPDRSLDERYFVRFDDGGFVRANPVTRRVPEATTRSPGDSSFQR